MASGRSFRRLLFKFLWPWFRDQVWPLIRDELVALLKRFAQDIGRWFEEWRERQTRREEEVRASAERARHAEKEAAAKGDAAEADTQRRIAEVWRNVADLFREENETLKKEFKDAMSRADDAVKQVEQSVDVHPTVDLPALTFAGRELLLPPPSPPTPLHCPKCGAEVLPSY